MPTILIAPDKFKGSLSAIDFCDICTECLKRHNSSILTKKFPLSDGGDGTVEIVKHYTEGKIIETQTTNPLNKQITASFLYSNSTKTAYIEMAEAAGLKLLSKEEQNPFYTTTNGVGKLILHASTQGAKHIILGIGGSATNDAGCGMAEALGYHFYNKRDKLISPTGQALNEIFFIDDSERNPLINNIDFTIACDVNNPFYGKNGAAFVYAPQKGADKKIVLQLDKGLRHFAEVIKNQYHIDLQNIKGSGAAGGLGGGACVFLNATLTKGIDLIMNLSNIKEHILSADYIITGEGRLDNQTLQGKVIQGVIQKAQNKKIIVFCGQNKLNKNQVKNSGIDRVYSIIDIAKNEHDAIINAATYLGKLVDSFCKDYLVC